MCPNQSDPPEIDPPPKRPQSFDRTENNDDTEVENDENQSEDDKTT